MNHLENETRKCIRLIEHSNRIVLINHRRMDGDALGSLSALYYVLKSLGKTHIECFNDTLTPEAFHFIMQEELFNPNLNLDDFCPDLLISLDCAGIEQLGSIYEKYRDIFETTPCIVIDHHASNPAYGTYNMIDPDASSTCEMLYDVMIGSDWKPLLDQRIASFLLLGIISDTNSFVNSNTTPKCLKIASDLLEYNPGHQEIIINLFKKKPYKRLKLWGKVLESLKSMEQGKIVWNLIECDDFHATNTTDKDLSGLLDEFIITIEGLEVGFFLYELAPGKIKGTFRSKTDTVNLSTFCHQFGGGGHPRAAGFLIENRQINELEAIILAQLKKFF